jgi:hypothetical protein
MRVIKARVFGDPALAASGLAPPLVRPLAVASLVCWAAAIVSGRMTAYPGLLESYLGF